MRKLFVPIAVLTAAFCLSAASVASADPVSALGVGCTQAGDGHYECSAAPRSTAETWDGTPIDVSVALPDPATYGNGPYPLVMVFHGWGQAKLTANLKHYTDKGYAAFTMTDRGFYESCGNAASVAADPDGCDGQYIRMMDDRYEVRDAQFFAGELVDEGWAEPTKIAATGGSYGGGISMALAALKDRTMKPDGRLVPWSSPNGTPMSLAVATPLATWSDIAYSLAPNGRVLDYLRDNPNDPNHFGVMKPSIMNGLYLQGLFSGRVAPAGELPDADMTGWLSVIDQGEPYQSNLASSDMVTEMTKYHSSYYINHSEKPAPILMANGFTDDIFPVDESLRFYNRTMAQYPNADLGMIFGDFGHQRAQNKAADLTPVFDLQDQWIDYYLAGTGSKPATDVIARTEACPGSDPSGGPYAADDWASLAPGEITVEGGQEDQTIAIDGGSGAVADAYAVLANSPCAAPAGDEEPGTANYESEPAPAAGFTLLGSPTVVADFEGAGTGSAIAARLVDVAPNNTKQLVARQIYRPNASGYQVFQLHPGGWKFEEGHVARLELLPKDGSGPATPSDITNYSRPSNMQQPITVHDLVLRLPVTESPGALGGLVEAPAPKVLPDDRGPVELAPGYSDSETMAEWVASRPETPPPPGVEGLTVTGPAKAKGRKMSLGVACQADAASCASSRIIVQSRRGKSTGPVIAMKGGVTVAPGESDSVSLGLSGQARKALGRNGRKSMPILVTVTGAAGESETKTTLKRAGKRR
ncbi:MAG: acetylxylan esterase [Solirubrobacterales bacterium]